MLGRRREVAAMRRRGVAAVRRSDQQLCGVLDGLRYSKMEQAEDLFLAEACGARRTGVGKELIEELAFLLEYLVDALLDRIGGHHPRNGYRCRYANAVGAIDGLILDGWIPPAIK